MATRERLATRSPKTSRRSALRPLLLAFCVVAVTTFSTPADADRHNPKRGGHPLRFIAYALHPVGYFLDTVLVRPAHWMVSRPSLAPIFGHTRG